MVRKKSSNHDLWFKIKISQKQLYAIIALLFIAITVFLLIYFDKIGYVIKWKIQKKEAYATSLITHLKDFGAKDDEIKRYQKKLDLILKASSKGFQSLNYLDKLNSFIDDIMQFKAKLVAYNKGYIAKISKIIKEVSVNIHNSLEWNNATIGLNLSSGDKVKTGEKSEADITTDSGNFLRINPESMIIIKDLSRNRKTFLPQEIYSISKSDNADYHIKTRNSNITLEDANSSFNIQKQSEVRINKKEQNATISVFKGLVEVKNTQGETRKIKTRQTLNISHQGIFKEMLKLPYPPELIEPLNLKSFKFKDIDDVSIKLVWSKQEKINTYHLQVAFDIDFNHIILDQFVNGISFQIKKLNKGNYFWKVASVSIKNNDIQSEFGQKKSFLVIFNENDEKVDLTPPHFEKLSIKKLTSQTILVEGKTEPTARLVVDSVKVTIHDDGTFKDIVPLNLPGVESVIVELSDSFGNMNRKKVSLF